jgi:hypothetical protein
MIQERDSELNVKALALSALLANNSKPRKEKLMETQINRSKQPVLDSFLRNCHMQIREGDAHLFEIELEGAVRARLDGYAIIPKEVYEGLLTK